AGASAAGAGIGPSVWSKTRPGSNAMDAKRRIATPNIQSGCGARVEEEMQGFSGVKTHGRVACATCLESRHVVPAVQKRVVIQEPQDSAHRFLLQKSTSCWARKRVCASPRKPCI